MMKITIPDQARNDGVAELSWTLSWIYFRIDSVLSSWTWFRILYM